jgi:superfamily II DNA or RNA helicase
MENDDDYDVIQDILGYIYILQRFTNPGTAKIGSTTQFLHRMNNYITPEPHFSNETHKIWKFDIVSFPFANCEEQLQTCCYQIDKMIRYTSMKYNIPYQHVNSSGGTEHYYFDNLDKLKQYFDLLNIGYRVQQIDVDIMREDMRKQNIKSRDSYESTQEDYFFLDEMFIDKNVCNVLDDKFKPKEKYKLRRWQEQLFETFKKCIKRLCHLIIAPTGTGKTIAFSLLLLYNILIQNKDIIIITKKKEILTQMKKTLPANIKTLLHNKFINLNFEPEIIDCIGSCSIEKLNKKYNLPSIYLLNFAQITNTNKFKNLENVNWDKFGMMIVDESHHCGATEINKLMTFIRENTNINILGFSATPLRCQKEHREKTEKLFSKNNIFDDISVHDDINVLYEYSYYEALMDKVICSMKWIPLIVSINDFIDEIALEDLDDELDNIKKYKMLSPNAFQKVWNQIKINIFGKSFKKKGIMWFRQRKDLLSFYKNMKDEIEKTGIKIFCSISYEEGDKNISNLVEECDLNKDHFNSAINDFSGCDENAILLSVYRAIEGFDEPKVDFGVRMYYSNVVDPVSEAQRMGRMNRIISGKTSGYFATLECEDDEISMRNNIISRLKNWIKFARSYTNNSGDKGKKEIEKQLKEIVEKYVDMNIVKSYNIDIEKEIIKEYQKKDFELSNIKKAIKKENNKRQDNKIDTKYKYDEWAENNNIPICDELEERHGIIDYKDLFGLKNDDYLGWDELVENAKIILEKNKTIKSSAKLYLILRKEINCIPPEPEVIYKDKFQSYDDLFFC